MSWRKRWWFLCFVVMVVCCTIEGLVCRLSVGECARDCCSVPPSWLVGCTTVGRWGMWAGMSVVCVGCFLCVQEEWVHCGMCFFCWCVRVCCMSGVEALYWCVTVCVCMCGMYVCVCACERYMSMCFVCMHACAEWCAVWCVLTHCSASHWPLLEGHYPKVCAAERSAYVGTSLFV